MLEAVVVVSVMVSAIAFVVTFEHPPPPGAAARQGLGQAAKDALAVLYDTPVDSKFGKDALSAYIAECLNGSCDNLKTRLDRLVPPGGAYALYISNGYETYPVYVLGEPSGEAVSASQQFEPAWSHTFVSTATDLVGVEDSLLTYALPIFNSNVVEPGGSHLLVRMIGQRQDGSDYVLIGSYSTVAQATDDPTAAAIGLNFVDFDARRPLAVNELDPDAVGNPRDHILRLSEAQGGTIPAGVEITVELPRGWTGRVNEDLSGPGWTVLSEATDKNGAYVGSSIRVRLDEEIQGPGHKDLFLTLTYHGDVLDFYPVHARLSRGAYATTSILLRGQTHANDPEIATPIMVMSAPSPMGKGATTDWTLSAYIPIDGTYLPGVTGGDVKILEISITEQEGNRIFGGVGTLEGPDGTWTLGGDHLVWRPNGQGFALNYGSFLNMTFSVSASGDPGPSAARSAFVPPISFDTWTGKLVQRSGWGFHRESFLPRTLEYEGFDPDAANGETPYSKEHPVSTDAVYRSTPLPGASTYHASLVGSVEEALYGAYVEANKRSVPVGGEIIIDANVQSMLFALAEAGQQAGVTLRFYPPWSGDTREAIFEQENLDQGLLASEVTQLTLIDINGDGFPDPVVGTTNGRVIAYHATSGQRLQGNTFTAPATAAAQKANTAARITALSTVELYGEPYIIVGTDKNSDGLFILGRDLSVKWRADMGASDVLAVDASVDIDRDSLAQPEIVVARAYEVGAAKNALVYVFKALDGIEELLPIPAKQALTQDPNAFAYALGTPTAILAQERAGPYGTTPGIAVPVQTTLDAGLTINLETFPPTTSRGALSTPRAGVQAFDADGASTSTLFGAPASVLRNFDRDSNGVDDLLMGGPSGYVVLANGEALTQPIYSYILAPTSKIIDADSPDHAESYVLTADGSVYMTDDAWVSNWGVFNPVVGAKAIASDGFNSVWAVGSANAIWRTVPATVPNPPWYAHHPEALEFADRRADLFDAYFLTHTHEFRDVWFDYEGDEGWIVGAPCIEEGIAECDEAHPFLMSTVDGGASWERVLREDIQLGEGQDAPRGALNKIRFMENGNGFAVGEDGLVLFYIGAEKKWALAQWSAVDEESTPKGNLRDIDCNPEVLALMLCVLVGDEGEAYVLEVVDFGEDGWWMIVGKLGEAYGLPVDRDFYSVGYAAGDRLYIGAHNMVLGRFGGSPEIYYDDADFTALPLNYLANDATVINTDGKGRGFIYGGGEANGRIWLLHDYFTQSQAQTTDMYDLVSPALPPAAVIKWVNVTETDVSLGLQSVSVEVTADGENWEMMGPYPSVPLLPPLPGEPPPPDPTIQKTNGRLTTSDEVGSDPRDAVLPFGARILHDGDDLRFRIVMNTAGDKTILSPHLRMLKFEVVGFVGDTKHTGTLTLRFDDDAFRDAYQDAGETTAGWDTTIGALRQPFVQEFWTRDVNGGVYDLRTGYDVHGADGIDEVWVATGDLIAEHSPDYAAYNPDYVIEADNRIYLLDGATGNPVSVSAQLDGEVRMLRIAEDSNGVPMAVYAVTWNAELQRSVLYSFQPQDLSQDGYLWEAALEGEVPADLDLGDVGNGLVAVYLGTQRSLTTVGAVGHLWAFEPHGNGAFWGVVTSNLGKYNVKTRVEPGWLFGPYVVEVEVSWKEQVTHEGTPHEIVRSARFYDHFMVTPPDALSPPAPVYTARLLVWMQDWG